MSSPSDLSGNFRRTGTRGAKSTDSDLESESTTLPAPAVPHFTFLRSITSEPILGRMLCALNRQTPSPSLSIIVRDYLVTRFGEQIAEDIKPLEIQRWLKSLNETGGLAWTTVSKIRGLMLRIYKIGILHEHVSKNPVLHVETRCKSNYRAIVITPAQTLAILKSLPSPLHYTLVLTCAATALRSSEILALSWSDILWGEGRIRVSKRWAKGEDGDTKTDASDGYVPLHPVSGRASSRMATAKPYAKATDFVFPSIESRRQETTLLFCIRRRSSAAGSKDSRSTHRGRPEVRASQSSPFA